MTAVPFLRLVRDGQSRRGVPDPRGVAGVPLQVSNRQQRLGFFPTKLAAPCLARLLQ